MEKGAVSAERMAVYVESARRREKERRRAAESRRTRALEIAKLCARLLKDDCGAVRVVVFGSIACEGLFDSRSDIDLAVWGLAFEDYWGAVRAVVDAARGFEVDLIRAEEAGERLLAAVESEGVEL